MNVFAYNHYKDFLRAYINQSSSRGVVTEVAQLCGCDRTYISQVLNSKADLTPDHLIQFCEGTGLDESESDYLMLVLLRDRAHTPRARKVLEQKIKSYKSEMLSTSRRVLNRKKANEIREDHRTLYYSSWIYGAIHLLASIRDYQQVNTISQKLNLPLATAQTVLKDLVSMGLLKQEEGRFVHSGGDLYLPRESSQNSAHHLTWRAKAVERCQLKEDVHYTVTFTISEKDVEKLRLLVLEFIEAQRKLVQSSGSEVACTICLDYFTL